MRKAIIHGIDLYCGVGGLSYGLRKAGIRIVAGIDLDPASEFPFTWNNKARFIKADVRDLSADELSKLYPKGTIRLLAGCAPCRPFSPFRRGMYNSNDREWGLLTEFGRFAAALKPELLTMVHYKSVYCPRFGVPQHRRRLVLLASLIGPVKVPAGALSPANFRTVRETLASLPKLEAGDRDVKDRLHRARSVNEINLRRLRSSQPGGTWEDWPESLRAECHRKKTGASYRSVYARMLWDEPAPTITTQAYNFGTGRFGHPEQDRSITLREAALLQTFPRRFKFVRPREEVHFTRVGRLIGNAVPPRLAFFIGREIMRAAATKRQAERVAR
jgi:DNA (cytosine-5)-methyltransferase 1